MRAGNRNATRTVGNFITERHPSGFGFGVSPGKAADLDWCTDLLERHRDIATEARRDTELALDWDSDLVTVKEKAWAKRRK